MQPLTQHFCLTSQGNCWSQTGWFSEPTQQRRRRRLTDFEGGGERECKHGEYGSVQMIKGGIFEAGFGEQVACSWPSVDRFGKSFVGLMTIGQVKSVPNFC